jgi:SAM-dependent methyltransferase
MEWHRRFLQQAAWTGALRGYLFKHAGLETAQRVLEVGCGTGAILADLAGNATIHGLDVLAERLGQAHKNSPRSILACGDARCLPYANGVFDITFCHYLLLWVHNPLLALLEMRRVTRPGGSILALAEPDYTARVDQPDVLAPLGRAQAQALQRQGADVSLGGRLAILFNHAGIAIIESGVLQADKKPKYKPEEFELEWEVFESDLAGSFPQADLLRLKRRDKKAWKSGERVLYVPTYYAWGRVVQMV